MIEPQSLSVAPPVPAASASPLADKLSQLARLRFALQVCDHDPQHLLQQESNLRAAEIDFVEGHRAHVRPLLAAVPSRVEGFLAWLDEMQVCGPGQNDPLFAWLEQTATQAEFRWFLQQEVAGEAGFDDLVALSQVKLPTRSKLELARNYWDEMGRGQARAMHGPMLTHLARAFNLETMQTPILWEALAVGHLMTALACNRWYVYQSLGALGAVELTAWRRAVKVNAGLKRLGYKGRDRLYYAVHATLDKKHGEAWTREVFAPLLARHPEAAQPLAEGLLLRMSLGAHSYAAYRRVLWGASAAAQTTVPGAAHA